MHQTKKSPVDHEMPLLARFLRTYHRTGLRGSYRITKLLSSHFASLQSLPIQTPSGILYADMRISSAHGLLANPQSQSGEDLAMRRFVSSGDVAFDIGAHLGLYTLVLSELVGASGKVFAFEPNAELLPSLKQTVQNLTNVELHDTALSDLTGSAKLFVPEDKSMASMTDWTNGIGGDVHTVTCRMETIDDLISSGELAFPDFIKCDVEGAELAVFRGARKTLDREDGPVILFEVNSKAASGFGIETDASLEFIQSLSNPRYKVFEVLPSGLRELPNEIPDYTNVVAIPAARLTKHEPIEA